MVWPLQISMSHKIAKPYACFFTGQSQRHSGKVGIRPIYKVFVVAVGGDGTGE